jgi:hypothetical protein
VEDGFGPAAAQILAPAPEDLLGGGVAVGDDAARVAHDQAFGHRVHHGAQALLVGDERLGGARALRGHRRQHERRQRRGGDEQLARQEAVGDRLAHERARVVRGVPDRQARDDRDRGRRAARPEPQRGPDQRREHHVGHVALGRELGEQDEDHEQRGPLDELTAAQALEPVDRPGQHQRRHHQRAREVRQPPRPPHLDEVPGGDHASQAQRGRAEGRADRGADGGRRREREHVADAVHRGPAAREPAQDQGRDDDLERVARRLAEHGPQRRREVGDEQIADHDARPQARSVQRQDRDADADRRPQRGHRPVEIREP